MRSDALQSRDAVDHIASEMNSIQIVRDGHVERCGCGSFFVVSAQVEIVVIGAGIREAVNEPRIAVIGKDDGLVGCEEGIEFTVGEAMRMFAGRLDGHQVDDVDDADFNVGEMLTEQIHGGKSFEGWNVTGAGHHHVGLRPLIVRSPLPNTDSARAMLDGEIHIEKLQCRLFAGNYYVDVDAAA